MHELLSRYPRDILLIMFKSDPDLVRQLLHYTLKYHSSSSEHLAGTDLIIDYILTHDINWEILEEILKMKHENNTDYCPTFLFFSHLINKQPKLMDNFTNLDHIKNIKLVIKHDHIQILDYILNYLIVNNKLTTEEISMIIRYAYQHPHHREIRDYLLDRFGVFD